MSKPITSPRRTPHLPAEELSALDQARLLDLHRDTPQNFRNMKERAKQPWRWDSLPTAAPKLITPAEPAVTIIPRYTQAPDPIKGQGYRLAFDQDFSKQTEVDRNVWTDHAWWETGVPDPAWTDWQVISGGELRQRTRREWGFPNNTMSTLGKAEFTYGYFEACGKSTDGKASFPAFWLTSVRHASNPAYPLINPYCAANGLPKDLCYGAEIDIMELYGGPAINEFWSPADTFLFTTVHRNTPSIYGQLDQVNPNQYNSPLNPDGSRINMFADYHVYSLLWLPDKLIWYLDGVELQRYTPYFSVNQPMFILLDQWLGGWMWPISPAPETPDLLEMSWRWIRVWQKVPSPPPPPTPPPIHPPPDQAMPAPPPKAAATTVPAPLIGIDGYSEVFRQDFVGKTIADVHVDWTDHIWYDGPPNPAWLDFQAVENNLLMLRSRREWTGSGAGIPFPQNTMTTQYTHESFQYGYYECECWFSDGKGMWPAFWLISQRHADNPTWPVINPVCAANGLPREYCLNLELDVFEFQGGDVPVNPGWPIPDQQIYQTVHRDTSNQYNDTDKTFPSDATGANQHDQGKDLTKAWHKYAMLWTPTAISFYFDDVMTSTVLTPDSGHQPMFLALSLWLGGWTFPVTDDGTPNLLQFAINTIRVWQNPTISPPL